VVSTQAYTIRSIFRRRARIRSQSGSDVIPQITPTVLTIKIRAASMHDARAIHPADGKNWTVIAGADAWTFELVAAVGDGAVFYPGFGVAYTAR